MPSFPVPLPLSASFLRVPWATMLYNPNGARYAGCAAMKSTLIPTAHPQWHPRAPTLSPRPDRAAPHRSACVLMAAACALLLLLLLLPALPGQGQGPLAPAVGTAFAVAPPGDLRRIAGLTPVSHFTASSHAPAHQWHSAIRGQAPTAGPAPSVPPVARAAGPVRGPIGSGPAHAPRGDPASPAAASGGVLRWIAALLLGFGCGLWCARRPAAADGASTGSRQALLSSPGLGSCSDMGQAVPWPPHDRTVLVSGAVPRDAGAALRAVRWLWGQIWRQKGAEVEVATAVMVMATVSARDVAWWSSGVGSAPQPQRRLAGNDPQTGAQLEQPQQAEVPQQQRPPQQLQRNGAQQHGTQYQQRYTQHPDQHRMQQNQQHSQQDVSRHQLVQSPQSQSQYQSWVAQQQQCQQHLHAQYQQQLRQLQPYQQYYQQQCAHFQQQLQQLQQHQPHPPQDAQYQQQLQQLQWHQQYHQQQYAQFEQQLQQLARYQQHIQQQYAQLLQLAQYQLQHVQQYGQLQQLEQHLQHQPQDAQCQHQVQQLQSHQQQHQQKYAQLQQQVQQLRSQQQQQQQKYAQHLQQLWHYLQQRHTPSRRPQQQETQQQLGHAPHQQGGPSGRESGELTFAAHSGIKDTPVRAQPREPAPSQPHPTHNSAPAMQPVPLPGPAATPVAGPVGPCSPTAGGGLGLGLGLGSGATPRDAPAPTVAASAQGRGVAAPPAPSARDAAIPAATATVAPGAGDVAAPAGARDGAAPAAAAAVAPGAGNVAAPGTGDVATPAAAAAEVPGSRSRNGGPGSAAEVPQFGPLSPEKQVVFDENYAKLEERATLVRTRVDARRAVAALRAAPPGTVHACDTEVADIDLKEVGPVGNGRVTCVSIYSGPDIDFGTGKGKTLWIDNLDEAEGVLQEFKVPPPSTQIHASPRLHTAPHRTQLSPSPEGKRRYMQRRAVLRNPNFLGQPLRTAPKDRPPPTPTNR